MEFWVGVGTSFQVGLENSLYKKLDTNLKQTKNDFDSNFYHFSLFDRYPNNFPVASTCILIFHDIYSPTQIFFFAGALNLFVLYLGVGKM